MWKKIIHVIITARSRMNELRMNEFASWEDKWEELAHIGTIKIAKKYNKTISKKSFIVEVIIIWWPLYVLNLNKR